MSKHVISWVLVAVPCLAHQARAEVKPSLLHEAKMSTVSRHVDDIIRKVAPTTSDGGGDSDQSSVGAVTLSSGVGAVCPFESQPFCQTAGPFLVNSDRLFGRSQVDDFRPTTGLIERICWSGCFTGYGMTAGACDGNFGGVRPPQAWELTIYEDDGGLPLSIPLHATYALVIDAEEPLSPTSSCWKFSAPLELNGVPDPLQVNPGECYWVKLDGLGENTPQVPCLVSVITSSDGNNLRLEDNNGVFEAVDQKTNDISFCLSSGMIGATSPPSSQDGGCGDRLVGCCLPDGSCVDTTYTACVGALGNFNHAWAMVGDTCTSGTCPAIPANDDCADAALVCDSDFALPVPVSQQGQCSGDPGRPGELCDPSANGGQGDCFDLFTCTPWPANQRAYDCSVESSNILASKDTSTANPCPGAAMNSDVWYELTAPCSGLMTIRTCRDSNYDGMMVAYVFHDGCADVCPIASNDNLLDCNDDYCPGTPGTSGLSGLVDKGACVKVAVGGFAPNSDDASAGRGLTVLDIGFLCDFILEVSPPALPGVVDDVDHDIRKQRFLSINPNNPVATTRMRLSLLDNGCSLTGKQCTDDASCTVCDGGANAGDACDNNNQCDSDSCVVSGETCEENSPPVDLGFILDPTLGGADSPPNTVLAGVGADPGFRVWDEPLVHIVDCEVAPGRVYRVAVEDEGLPGSFSSLDMRTSVSPPDKDWGDMVGQFDGADWTAGNQLVNVDDVNVIIKFLSLDVNAPHVTRCELLSPNGPSFVNMDVSADELGQVIRCFKGELFPPLPMLLGGYPDLNGQLGPVQTLLDCSGN